MVNLIVENKIDSFSSNSLQYEHIVEDALEKLGRKSNIIIELLFVGKEEIQELNKKFREKDTPTDVLSFPQEQFDVKENILGSIVISPEIAKEREEEIEQLIKHGTLHLLGYDHEENEKEWDEVAKVIDCNY